jgi:hypothetical protein
VFSGYVEARTTSSMATHSGACVACGFLSLGRLGTR